MSIAYITSALRGENDRVLRETATRFMAEGLRLSGAVETDRTTDAGRICDMQLHVLPDGPVIPISQPLGADARGCRLDPGALESAVAAVEATLHAGTDLLIINKFGKHELDGRGFCQTIAQALELGVPVLLGLNAANLAPFQAWVGGMAKALPPDPDAVNIWFRGLRNAP
ncbi:DUF2478 domain-containing protein [Falsirhodobacter sp. alg1]|uniref:DUF2478 domain-containing protein n=1 Tax=Falsirhodobacter sp. alg1 TaxID=1472418 RepID=UPI0005EF3F17|nr:DUF2478 domain-containing protein [Falsirhodobacter sp. alg1]